MKNLTTAIYLKFTGSALDTLINGNLFKSEAPENTDMPYVVYFVVSDIPEYPGGKTIEKFDIQFSIFSSASSSSEVEDILTTLRALYDDCVLTITGNTPIYFIRENFTAMRDEITTTAGTAGVWHYVQEYSGWMVKT
jgi:hypothetical protein